MHEWQPLQEQYNLEVRRDETLAKHCTYEVGGPADFFCEPHNMEALRGVLQLCRAKGTPVTIIGKGSNLLVSDRGIRGMVVCLAGAFAKRGFLQACPGREAYAEALNSLTAEPQIDADGFAWLFSEAGASMIEVSKYASSLALGGLEFACGIPGTVGGAVYMNAGAYGGMTQEVAAITYYLDADFELRAAVWDEQNFGYRRSLYQDVKGTILATCYRLQPGDAAEINSKVAELTAKREKSQPLEYPSCGSVFKRPEGYYAGKLIMDSGLQGFRIGGAEVSLKHAGFIVNRGGATATDIADLIAHIRKTVAEKFGVTLETEVRFIGDW